MNTKAKTVRINKTVARKVLETVDAGLCSGLGEPIPGQMCVEAAVCYALGLPHGDNPACVGSAVRAFKINLNDAAWSSSQARAAGMRKLAIAQLGSDTLDQCEFAKRLALATVQKIVPLALRATLALAPAHADALNAAAKTCEITTDLATASATARAAYAARAAAYAAADAARAAADAAAAAYAAADAADAAYAATRAADAAADAARAAAYAARAAAYAAADAARNKHLECAADIVLQVLIDMRSPGCKYLALADASP